MPFRAPPWLLKCPSAPKSAPSACKSARDLLCTYLQGTTTPVKVAQQILDFLNERNGDHGSDEDLHWFVQYSRQQCMQAAEESAARWQQGSPLSVLDGVPFAVKDNMDAAGYDTRAGTQWLHHLCAAPASCCCLLPTQCTRL